MQQPQHLIVIVCLSASVYLSLLGCSQPAAKAQPQQQAQLADQTDDVVRGNPKVEVVEKRSEGELSASEKGKKKMAKVVKTEEEWRELLTPEQFKITRKKGTERAGTGKYANHKEKGTYTCVCCGLELFASENMFDSGTGWPSFDQAVEEDHVAEKEDRSLFRARTEVLCNRCDAHLGHVFDDGPRDTTGMRYCINSAALDFAPGDQPGGELDKDEAEGD